MKKILTALLLLIGVTCHAQVTPQYYIVKPQKLWNPLLVRY